MPTSTKLTVKQPEIFNMFKGAIIVFGSRVIGAAAVFGTQILLARWMGATEVGIYVYAFSLCNLLSIVACLGLPSSALRYVGEAIANNSYGYIVGLARIGLQIVLFSGLCFAFFGEWAVYLTDGIISPQYISALTVAMVTIPMLGLMNWQSAIAQCLGWFSAAFMPVNVSRPVLLVVAIALAYKLGHALDAAYVMLLHLVIMILLFMGSQLYMARRLARRFPNTKPRYQTADWLRTGIPLLFVNLFSSYFLDINIVAVGLFLNPEQLAIFNACFRVAVLIAFGLQSIDAILMPRFTQLYALKDRVGLQRIVALSTQLKFWSSIVALIIFTVFGKNIMAYFGQEFIQGYDALRVLTLSQVVRAAVGPLSQILSLTGHHAYCLIVSILSALVMVILNYYLIPALGLNGAALTVLIVIALESILLSYANINRLGIDASVFGVAYIIPFGNKTLNRANKPS